MKNNEINTVTLKRPLLVPRMRTLNKALEEIRAVDPDTAISMRAIRCMIANGELQVYYVGKKRLINLDMLFEASFEKREINRRAKFKEVADEWLDLMEKTQEIKISTLERMKGCRERTYEILGNLYIDNITYSQLQRFIVSLSAKGVNQHNSEGLSQKSQKHYLTFISDVMTYAIRCGLIRKPSRYWISSLRQNTPMNGQSPA